MAGSMSSNSTCEDDEPPLKKRKSDSIGRGSGEESFLSDHGGLEGQSAPVDVREEAVGISEYVSSHSGFFAILKRRLASKAMFTSPEITSVIAFLFSGLQRDECFYFSDCWVTLI